MALTTYAELQTAVQAWLMDRTDLAGYVPDFITLAENWLNYGSDTTDPLRVTEMEAVATLTPSSGIAALPDDFLSYISVGISTAVVDEFANFPAGTPQLASYKAPLDWIAPNLGAFLYPSAASGVPVQFTVIGTYLYSFPRSTSDLVLIYYQAIPALSDANTSNWLLAKAPGVYLRAALAQAAEFIKDDGEAAKQFEMARALVAGLNKTAFLGRYGRSGISFRGVVA